MLKVRMSDACRVRKPSHDFYDREPFLFQESFEMSLVQQHTSIALIRSPDEPEQRWLAVWRRETEDWSFVKAERIEHESWRECLDRELAWVFPLRRGKDYLISTMARLHLEETVADSDSGQERHVATEFFVVDPYGRKGKEAFSSLDGTRWLSNSELKKGVTVDGQNIDADLTALLRQADILSKG